MSSVTIDQLESYVVASGWSLRGRLRSGATQWFRQQDHVLIPGADDPQVSRLLDHAVTRIATAEDRGAPEVISDAVAGDADRLVAKVKSKPVAGNRPTEVPLTFGVTLLQSVRELLAVAATRAAGQTAPRSEERRWRDALLRATSLTVPTEGSYVVAMLIPPSLSLPTRLGASAAVQNFGHQTSIWLQRIFREVRDAADTDASHYVFTARPEALEPAIRLLEAMPEGEVSFALSFSSRWEGQPPPSPAVTLATVDLPRLEAAARALGARGVVERQAQYLPELEEPPRRREIETFVLRGPVIALRRPQVTIEGFVEGARRRVRVTIADDQTYNLLAAAHAERRAVRVVGRLVLRPRTASAMESVSSVEIEGYHE